MDGTATAAPPGAEIGADWLRAARRTIGPSFSGINRGECLNRRGIR
jgi:hypothetical protein